MTNDLTNPIRKYNQVLTLSANKQVGFEPKLLLMFKNDAVIQFGHPSLKSDETVTGLDTT